jgi:hypothetical protein
MKKIILLCVLCAFVGNAFAQKETFDLATFTAPKAWKQEKTEAAIQFSKEDAAKGTYCLITLYKAVPGTANSKENFDLAWASLVKEMVKVSTRPEMQPSATENGWETQSGLAPFESDGNKGVVVLVTSTGFEKMVNLIILTNTDVYEKDIAAFLESISLKKTETIPQQAPGTNDGKNSILGSWGKSNTVSQVNNRFSNYSYNKQQYTFNADGSYSFAAKTYDEKYSETLLIKEKGNFVITENTITITPKKSVIEAWSKKNGADNWNQLKSTQKRSLEIVTYQFSIADNNLLLQTAKQTKRDGSFNNGNTYTYGPPGTFTPIKLPEGDQLTSKEIEKEPAQQTATTANAALIGNGFTFTTTNFDDGWTSTVQEDWVLVTKGNIRVLLHYPTSKIDVSSMDYETISNNAWNTLVAPRYSDLQNYFNFRGSADYERPHFISGDVTDKTSGKKVHVALFKKGKGGWIEIISPDKASFVQTFGLDINKVDYYVDSKIWEPLQKLANCNKFAVSAADLKGKWTNNFTGMTQYVNIYTGADAGADTHASNEVFEFGPGNMYKWELKVASGFVGNIKFQGVKSNGKFSVTNNWQVYFSEIERKARTYNAYFSCIKDARILWLEDAGYPIGYTGYGKVNN